MLQGKYMHPAARLRAANSASRDDDIEPAWKSNLEPALQRAAGVAIAVVAPDGTLLHLQHNEQPANAADSTQRRQLRQWLEGREWIKELMASDAFERAAREGMFCRETAILAGSEPMLEQTIVPLAADGVTGPVLVAMRNLSNWRRFAAGIERLSQFYEVTLNTMADGILWIDAEGAIDFANPAAARLLGWSIEEMIGFASSELLGTDRHLHQPDGIAGEASFRRRNGDFFAAEFRISAKQEGDARQGTVMVFANISARQATERELRELRESNAHLHNAMQALEATQQQLFMSEKMSALGRFATGVVYEIGTPLTYLGCNLKNLETYTGKLLRAAEQGGSGTGNKQLPDLDFLRRDIPALFAESTKSLGRMTHLVENLRTLSRIDPTAECSLGNLNAGLASTLALLAQEIGDGVEIHNEIVELPLVQCQMTQVNQVFHNLLAYAIRAVGGKGEIWLRSGGDNHEVWIEIADNGCDMASEPLQQPLEPFLITHATSQDMGLSVAYGIIKRHGGVLSASNRPGGGTVFRVVLPIAPGSDAHLSSPAVPPH